MESVAATVQIMRTMKLCIDSIDISIINNNGVIDAGVDVSLDDVEAISSISVINNNGVVDAGVDASVDDSEIIGGVLEALVDGDKVFTNGDYLSGGGNNEVISGALSNATSKDSNVVHSDDVSVDNNEVVIIVVDEDASYCTMDGSEDSDKTNVQSVVDKDARNGTVENSDGSDETNTTVYTTASSTAATSITPISSRRIAEEELIMPTIIFDHIPNIEFPDTDMIEEQTFEVELAEESSQKTIEIYSSILCSNCSSLEEQVESFNKELQFSIASWKNAEEENDQNKEYINNLKRVQEERERLIIEITEKYQRKLEETEKELVSMKKNLEEKDSIIFKIGEDLKEMEDEKTREGETKKAMKKQCEKLKEVISERDLVIVELEQNMKCKNQQVRIMEENNSVLMDKNVKLQNEKRLLIVQGSGNIDSGSGEILCPLGGEFEKLYKDHFNFKEYISEQLKQVKVQLGQQHQEQHRQQQESRKEKYNEGVIKRGMDVNKEDKEEKENEENATEKESSKTTKNKSTVDRIDTLLTSNTSLEHQKDGKTRTSKKTLIFTTSISKGIKPRRFNDIYKENNNNKEFNSHHVQFSSFPVARMKHMASYVTPRISDEKPETVIVHGGGNDLPVYPADKTIPLWDIANQIINAGLVAKKHNVRDILIGGVTTRKGSFLKKRCEALNGILIDLCKKHRFTYIDNSDIMDEHLYENGVHLNDEGTTVLADNYLKALRQVHQRT